MSTELRALFVDDSQDDVDLLVWLLRQHGYEPITFRRVVSVAHLMEALGETWDLVVSDCSVPNLGPLEILALLRGRSIDLPLIVVSGVLPPTLAAEAMRAGAAGCADKDDSERLLALVDEVLGTLEARRRARATPAGSGDLERLFALAQDMLCVAGFDGYFKRTNPAFERTLGFATEELLARPFIDFVHPEDRERTAAEVRKQGGGAPTLAFQNRYRCKDGSYKWLSWTSQPVPSEGLFYAIARDVSEAVRLEQQLTAATKELEAFSYSVSHDLRAPLRSIAGFSEILLKDYGGGLEPEAKDFLQRIVAAARRSNALIDDLLTLARAPRQEMRPSRVDLAAMAQQIAARLREREPDRAVDLLCPERLEVEADAQLLEVVLENLLGNAWKYTRKRPDARVEIGRVGQKGHRAYFVRDNGAGFDMAFADRLFEPFRRLHAAEEFEGTGVGLATVQRIIIRHGGRIWAEAQVDRGAVFYFTLGEQIPARAAPRSE